VYLHPHRPHELSTGDPTRVTSEAKMQ
jgi:hypothetical protein